MLHNCLSSNFCVRLCYNIVLSRKALFAPQILIMHYQYYCIFCKIYPQLTWRAKARVQTEIQSKYLIVLYMFKEFFLYIVRSEYRKVSQMGIIHHTWCSRQYRSPRLSCQSHCTLYIYTYIVPLYDVSVILIYGSLGRYNNLSPW